MGDDLYYDGIGTVENMKRIFLHYLHRNTFEALRDLAAQAIVSFLALMLFARFHFGGEDFPNSNTSFPSIKSRRQDTNASLVELRKTVLEERRSEKYDALLVGIGDAFHAIARDLRQEGPSRAPTDPSASSSLTQPQLLVLSMDRTVRNVRELWDEYIRPGR
ncbi:hypothetical protein I312_103145 [Cryptococcus bacillisporus CA1280]|uniref:uncharacterized protein n=1 Tax=Cryptococcus bacillisporus CA1280 TaxID=1296109 RepID=UPI0033698304